MCFTQNTFSKNHQYQALHKYELIHTIKRHHTLNIQLKARKRYIMETCPWINKKNEQCGKSVKTGKTYCSFHQKYEGIYDLSELSSLKFCTRCSRVFVPDETTKTQCQSCVIEKGRNHLCGWINQKGKPCPWKALKGGTYCKRHSKYEGVFKPEDIKSLKKCSGCKNLFKPTGSCKTCDTCVTRSRLTNERIRSESNEEPECQAIVQRTGLKCSHKAKDGTEYCGEHQTYAKWKMLTDHGMCVCNNWVRGCWNECHDGYKRCYDCRRIEREKDKHRLEKKHTLQSEEVKYKRTSRTCVRCSVKQPNTEFEADHADYCPSGSTPRYCKECKSCRQKASIRDTRDRSDKVDTRTKADRPKTFNFRLNSRYDMYKFRDCEKGLSVKETYEEYLPRDFAYKLMILSCMYCAESPTDEFPNGLDRLDNSKGHILGNVVPCCHQCNMMKGTLGVKRFREHCERIAKHTRQTLV